MAKKQVTFADIAEYTHFSKTSLLLRNVNPASFQLP